MRQLIALCLLAAPAFADDARKLAEAGWTAYQKHDLANAEKLTRQAIAATDDVDVKGAALYNLGRILEDRKDKAGAITAYKDSFATRKNGAVRERLGTLDATAAAALDTFKPQPMQGPFASLEAYCKHWLANEPADTQKELVPQCAAAAVLKPKTAVKLPAAVQGLEMRALYQSYALLVVKLGGQLYVQELHPLEESGHCDMPEWRFTGVTSHGAALEVSYEAKGLCTNREDSVNWHESAFTVVGIGASNKPSALPELDLEMTETGTTGLNHVYKATWAKDGAAVDIAIVKASGEGFEGLSVSTEDIKGHHVLAFP